MFKFLRKYQSWILVVGGSLLMIVFLIPQAITALAQRSAVGSATIATLASGESVDGDMWAEVQGDMQVLSDMPLLQFQFSSIGGISTPDHWYLLTLEAQRAGLIPSGPSTLSGEELNAVALSIGQPRDIVARVFNKAQGIGQMLAMYHGVSEMSDVRLKERARRLLSSIQLKVLAIEADPDAEGLPESTESQILAQFEAHRESLPGEGEQGFGYRYPDRFKLEWIGIDAMAIRQWVQDQGIDQIELRRHWNRRQGNVGVPMVDPANPGADVPASVIEDYKRIKSLEMMATIRQDIRMALQSPLREIPRANGAYQLPDDWDQNRVSFEQLALELQAKHGIPLPEFESRRDRWYTVDDLRDFGQVGFASTDELSPGTQYSIETLIPLLRELGSESPIAQQVGVALPLLQDFQQRLFAIRITEVDPSHAPESVDEVRDDVDRDLRRLAHYALLSADRENIAAYVRDNGFLPAAVRYKAPVQGDRTIGLVDPGYVNSLRQGQGVPTIDLPELPVVGRQDEILRDLVNRTLQFETRSLQDIPREERIFSYNVDDALAVMIVMIEHEVPVNDDTFKTVITNQALQRLLLSIETDMNRTLRETFSYDALAERYGFERTARDDEDLEETDAAEDA